MNPIFNELQAEKRNRILNAAFDEFAARGFMEASTNNIVKSAGISKGVLFYYFNSKAELFDDLMRISIDILKENYLDKINFDEKDIIKRYKEVGNLKYRALNGNPHVFNFFSRFYIRAEKKLPEESKARRAKLLDEYAGAFSSGAETSLFRKDLPAKRVREFIKWCVEGYERDLMARFSEAPSGKIMDKALWDDFYTFLDELKKIFYEEAK